MKSDIMTIKEIASYLKVKHITIYRLAQKGKIPASKIGGQWRFKKERIDQWFEEHENVRKRKRGHGKR